MAFINTTLVCAHTVNPARSTSNATLRPSLNRPAICQALSVPGLHAFCFFETGFLAGVQPGPRAGTFEIQVSWSDGGIYFRGCAVFYTEVSPPRRLVTHTVAAPDPSAPGSGAMAVTPRTAHANHDFPSQYPCTCLSHARRCGWTIRRGQWTGAGGLGGQLQKWSAHSTCTRTAAWRACSHVSRRRDERTIAMTSSPWPRKRARFASHGARLLWRQAPVAPSCCGAL